MSAKSITVKHSLREIRAKRARGEDKTRPDAPEAETLGEEFWHSARVVMPKGRPPYICAWIAMWLNDSRRVARDI